MQRTSEIRIISGQFKGAKLDSPHSAATHPMGSRERLALFNMIETRAAKVLDLYAGSGALGLEAISRGAVEIKFVDDFAPAISTIKSNLQRLFINPQVTERPITQVIRAKVSNFLQEAADCQNYFDVIFADPPYDQFIPTDLEKVVNVLAPAGIFALSSPARLPEVTFPGLKTISTHTYAAARLTIYRKIS